MILFELFILRVRLARCGIGSFAVRFRRVLRILRLFSSRAEENGDAARLFLSVALSRRGFLGLSLFLLFRLFLFLTETEAHIKDALHERL